MNQNKQQDFFFYIHDTAHLAGTEMYVYTLAKKIKADGHNVHFVTMKINQLMVSKMAEVFGTNIFALETNIFNNTKTKKQLAHYLKNNNDNDISILVAHVTGFETINHLFVKHKIIVQIHFALGVKNEFEQYYLNLST